MPDKTLVDLLGRSLVLHDHTWFGHISKRHPDMRLLRSRAESAVTHPLRICFSASDPQCRIYYGVTATPGIMVAVIGDVAGGFIRTAYRTGKIKGTPEW